MHRHYKINVLSIIYLFIIYFHYAISKWSTILKYYLLISKLYIYFFVSYLMIMLMFLLLSYCSFSSLIFSSIFIRSFYILSTRYFLKREEVSDARVVSKTKKNMVFALLIKIHKILKVNIWWIIKCILLKLPFFLKFS